MHRTTSVREQSPRLTLLALRRTETGNRRAFNRWLAIIQDHLILLRGFLRCFLPEPMGCSYRRATREAASGLFGFGFFLIRESAGPPRLSMTTDVPSKDS